MGYSTYVTGAITITPPIPWSEVEDSPFVTLDRAWVERDVRFHIAEAFENGADGVVLSWRRADAVVPAHEDSYKAYDINEHLQELVDAHGAGRVFSGYLSGEGEDNDDMWRLYVRDGRAVRVKPEIVWPDEAVPS